MSAAGHIYINTYRGSVRDRAPEGPLLRQRLVVGGTLERRRPTAAGRGPEEERRYQGQLYRHRRRLNTTPRTITPRGRRVRPHPGRPVARR